MQATNFDSIRQLDSIYSSFDRDLRQCEEKIDYYFDRINEDWSFEKYQEFYTELRKWEAKERELIRLREEEVANYNYDPWNDNWKEDCLQLIKRVEKDLENAITDIEYQFYTFEIQYLLELAENPGKTMPSEWYFPGQIGSKNPYFSDWYNLI